MLVLGRRAGESIMINDDIKITVAKIQGNVVRIGIDAPKDVRIDREEIYLLKIEDRIIDIGANALGEIIDDS